VVAALQRSAAALLRGRHTQRRAKILMHALYDVLHSVQGWRPSITVAQVVKGVQKLLEEPNEFSPAQEEAYRIYVNQKQEYRRRVLQQAKRYTV
jgi:ubiquitin-protein ligase